VGYALRGKWGSAAVTALGIIPYVGDVAKAGHTAATLTRVARQASRELKPVVIGENMKRVEAYARRIGAETINDWLAGRKWSLELNAVWVHEMKEQGRRVIDIGPHFERRWRFIKGLEKGQPPSDVYALERRLLKGYPLYEKHFIRGGRYGGGVPGLSIGEDWATEPFFP
jgi:hypothetical protein